MLDSLFIVDSNGCVVIEKHWRQLVPRRIVDELVVAVTSEVAAAAAAAAASAAQTAAAAAGETNGAGSSAEALSSGSLASVLPADAPAAAAASLAGRPADGVLPPITSIEQYKMLYISRFGLLFVAAVSTEAGPTTKASPASIFFFLHQIVELFTDYFVGISEVTLKENFVIVYELLEELVDYGSPYITEPCLLKDMIPPPSLLSTMINAVSIGTQFSSKQPTGTVSTVPWRPTGLKYTNNEIFFDIIEELDVIVDK
nr:AP-3 complex subunit mu-2 [Polyrhizophydium stewartii]